MKRYSLSQYLCGSGRAGCYGMAKMVENEENGEFLSRGEVRRWIGQVLERIGDDLSEEGVSLSLYHIAGALREGKENL